MSQKNIQFSLVNSQNKSLGDIEISGNSTVLELKKEIQKKIGLNRFRQKLTFGDKNITLDNEEAKLSDYQLSNGQLKIKDLGPQVGWRTVFLIEYAGPLIIYPALYLLSQGKKDYIQTIACLLVIFHYFKRELESVFVHIFSKDTMPFWGQMKNHLHYWFIFGFGVGIEVNFFWKNPNYEDWIVYLLVALFFVFEFLNLMSHITLRNLRVNSKSQRGIPYGWGFDLVSSANYLWETLSWAAFALLVRTWTAYIFLIFSTVTMTLWAIKKHKRYFKEFDGKDGRPKYPRNRKAIFPFII